MLTLYWQCSPAQKQKSISIKQHSNAPSVTSIGTIKRVTDTQIQTQVAEQKKANTERKDAPVKAATEGTITNNSDSKKQLLPNLENIKEQQNNNNQSTTGTSASSESEVVDNTEQENTKAENTPPRTPAEAVANAAEQAIQNIEGDLVDEKQNHENSVSTRKRSSTVPQTLERGSRIVLREVNFKFGSATLTTESLNQLQRITEKLKEKPEINIEIASYTDSIGNSTANKNISQLRSEAIKDYFISNKIKVERLTAKGYGSESPVVNNTTKQGRKKDHRVEIYVR